MDYMPHNLEEVFEVSKVHNVFTKEHLKTIIYNILDGVNDIHQAGLIHRDLKPANILIDEHCNIKVADFGFSESMDATKSYFKQNQDDTIKLPMKWLAPESINDGVFSEKTDVVNEMLLCMRSVIW